MKVKTSEATPIQLNWMVAKCKGIEVVAMKEGRATFSDPTDDGALNEMPINYSTDWAQGGPIIEREEIGTKRRMPCMRGEEWEASGSVGAKGAGYSHAFGPTPLIAAMRCYVASRLGEEVDMPDELI